MKIHEYQAKAILARHGVPVPRGEVAFNVVDARDMIWGFGAAATVCVAATLVPLRVAIRRLESLER